LGKSYVNELKQLEKTFAAAVEVDIKTLCLAIISASTLPLYVIGSGGSLSAAHLVAYLNQRFAKQFAKAITPLEAVNLSVSKQSWFWFFSAGGRNLDINDAFRSIVLKEPKHLLVTCASTDSPLVRYARSYKYTDVFEFDLPFGRDGFLATNSLIAFAIIVVRAYQSIFLCNKSTPDSILNLLKYNGTMVSFLSFMRELCAPLWEREHLLVLFGPSTQPAAFDLESKFTEAALGSVLLADYRNFAHGRHHWLAKRGNASAVLALSVDNEKHLAEKTLSILPQGVPVVHLDFSDQSIYAPIAALVTVLHVVALAGEARTIDPGRPGVPAFGRKMYHMRGLKSLIQRSINISVRRKVLQLVNPSEQQLITHKRHYRKFIQEIQRNVFASIIMDYDGTLCTPEQRFTGIHASVAEELIRLLEAGIPIGIATGRGKSVREALRQAIPKYLWQRIIIGYYNGAECGDLHNEELPDGTSIACSSLAPLADALLRNQDINNICNINIRKYQITVEPSSLACLDIIWATINTLIHQYGSKGTRAVASDHSFDILAPFVSKTKVVELIKATFGLDSASQILCVGDKGAWPGNDYELLQMPFSLSVDEVPFNSTFCWNLAPAGYKGVQAMLFYFKCMNANDGSLTFKLC
jgi:hydroxymethylpyrimidine pyrophosphatase-like HAD family hydrolase